MEIRVLAACSLFTLLVIGIPCVHAQGGVTAGPDIKWSHAQSFDEDRLAAFIITDEDIAFARGRVAASREDCVERGGVWCTYWEDDQKALQKMLNVQARQSGNPRPVDPGPETVPGDLLSSAWKQLQAYASQLDKWISDLWDALDFTP